MNLKKSFLCLFIFLSIFACTPKIFAVITRAQRAAAEVQRATKKLRAKNIELQTKLKKALADDKKDSEEIAKLREKLERARRAKAPEVAAPDSEEIKILMATNKKLKATNERLRKLLKKASDTIGKEIEHQDVTLAKINNIIKDHENLELENERLRKQIWEKVEPEKKKKEGFWRRLFSRKKKKQK